MPTFVVTTGTSKTVVLNGPIIFSFVVAISYATKANFLVVIFYLLSIKVAQTVHRNLTQLYLVLPSLSEFTHTWT